MAETSNGAEIDPPSMLPMKPKSARIGMTPTRSFSGDSGFVIVVEGDFRQQHLDQNLRWIDVELADDVHDLFAIPGAGIDQNGVALLVPDDGHFTFEETTGGWQLIGTECLDELALVFGDELPHHASDLTRLRVSQRIDEGVTFVGLFGIEFLDDPRDQFEIGRRSRNEQRHWCGCRR